jgi:hypothetical protein
VGVEFVAIIPTADKLTILAAVADHEREAISERSGADRVQRADNLTMRRQRQHASTCG